MTICWRTTEKSATKRQVIYCGTSFVSLFFKKINDYYVPNTALMEDARDITTDNDRIVVILEKYKEESAYTNILYVAKKIDACEVLKNIDCQSLKFLVECLSKRDC